MRILRIGAMLLCALNTAVTGAAEIQLDDGKENQGDLAVREQLHKRLAEIAKNPVKYQEAIYFGELRATLCKVCHGDDGNSVREGTPNLAGQNPVYIVDQFNRYADGRRLDYWMGSLARRFTDDDKIKLAIFYAEQSIRPAKNGNPALIDQGRLIYEAHCAECHGADGKGPEGYARLAGQRAEYTIKMLKEFKSAKGKRFNPLMYARANMLNSNLEIEAVAGYLASLDIQ